MTHRKNQTGKESWSAIRPKRHRCALSTKQNAIYDRVFRSALFIVLCIFLGKTIEPIFISRIICESVGSRNLQIERTVRSVNKAICGNDIWVAGRGFEALNLYEIWFSLNYHFVIRQRGDHCVIISNGFRIVERDLVEPLRQKFARLYRLRLGKIPLEPLKNG